jgi:hypothetical protein
MSSSLDREVSELDEELEETQILKGKTVYFNPCVNDHEMV